jgi:hypothetical protein
MFSDEEAAHFLACDRCIIALAICRLSKSFEEADRRLQDHLASD